MPTKKHGDPSAGRREGAEEQRSAAHNTLLCMSENESKATEGVGVEGLNRLREDDLTEGSWDVASWETGAKGVIGYYEKGPSSQPSTKSGRVRGHMRSTSVLSDRSDILDCRTRRGRPAREPAGSGDLDSEDGRVVPGASGGAPCVKIRRSLLDSLALPSRSSIANSSELRELRTIGLSRNSTRQNSSALPFMTVPTSSIPPLRPKTTGYSVKSPSESTSSPVKASSQDGDFVTIDASLSYPGNTSLADYLGIGQEGSARSADAPQKENTGPEKEKEKEGCWRGSDGLLEGVRWATGGGQMKETGSSEPLSEQMSTESLTSKQRGAPLKAERSAASLKQMGRSGSAHLGAELGAELSAASLTEVKSAGSLTSIASASRRSTVMLPITKPLVDVKGGGSSHNHQQEARNKPHVPVRVSSYQIRKDTPQDPPPDPTLDPNHDPNSTIPWHKNGVHWRMALMSLGTGTAADELRSPCFSFVTSDASEVDPSRNETAAPLEMTKEEYRLPEDKSFHSIRGKLNSQRSSPERRDLSPEKSYQGGQRRDLSPEKSYKSGQEYQLQEEDLTGRLYLPMS
eukprot:1178172-Prorocentrum_minimum.AAC.7